MGCAGQQALGADLTQFNGEDSWTLPMPARYVIDQDGVVAYAEPAAASAGPVDYLPRN